MNECVAITRTVGFLEPFSDVHVPPDGIEIEGPNYRESLMARGLLSRNRAVLWLMEQIYGSLDGLRQQQVYLAEALSGFARWMRNELGGDCLQCSEFLHDAEGSFHEVQHQDLSALSFGDASFELVICNELFEHIQNLQAAFGEIARVLRPGGRLLATCPLAFGQKDSILKVRYDPVSQTAELMGDAEFHGDPVRPESGSLVYQIPGWDVLDHLKAAGFRDAAIHHIASWKHGVMGSDLPGVLVIHAER
ncbi:MAG: class I SAM-dependent methyltransferase [Cyanobium sp.]